MSLEPALYDLMQRAVDIVGTSPHPTNKIAATLSCADGAVISCVNLWPPKIAQAFAPEEKIGNASGTIHAELACIYKARHTMQAQLFITDPPCPNCAKNIAEAGIKALYLDHKGFDKDFAHRRGQEFEAMSMRILERAGIAVYKMFRKDRRIEPILLSPEGYLPLNEYPVRLRPLEQGESFSAFIASELDFYQERPFAAAIALDGEARMGLSAQSHPTLGYSHDTLEPPDGKYSFVLEPLNRILMAAARKGVRIAPEDIYSARIPSARELVNFIGAGYGQLHIGDFEQARDIFGPIALNQLQKAGILAVSSLQPV